MASGSSADAVLWLDGRIQAVGRAREIGKGLPAGIPRYELPGATVTPGFVDSHTHFGLWALNRRRVELRGARSPEEAVQRVASAQPVQGWVIGQGWDANNWSRPPDRHVLDEAQQVPVYLDSLDVHAAWVNSATLAVAGITRDSTDPTGGRIVRDGNGEPTGLLLERAVELVLPHLPTPPASVLDDALLEAQAEAHRVGITAIHDIESMSMLSSFQRLEAADQLRLRVLFHPPVSSLADLLASGTRSGQGSGWLTIGGVKLFLDGSLGSRTAWMLEPYAGTRDRGMPITGAEEARDAMDRAAAAGLASTVHAIGDAAVRHALDLLSRLPRLPLPHRIEHFQCVHPADLQRSNQLGLVLSMQPPHLLTDIPLVDRHWGDRGQGAYAFKSLLRAGARLIFGSDVPVASIDPREGVYSAMERKAADGAPPRGWHVGERLSFHQVLRAYTVEPARAAGAEARRGALAPGFDADLVAWEMDGAVEHGDGTAFRQARAVLTVVGGEAVMRV